MSWFPLQISRRMDLALEKARATRQMWGIMRLWIRVLSFMVEVGEEWDEGEDEDAGDLFMLEKIWREIGLLGWDRLTILIKAVFGRKDIYVGVGRSNCPNGIYKGSRLPISHSGVNFLFFF